MTKKSILMKLTKVMDAAGVALSQFATVLRDRSVKFLIEGRVAKRILDQLVAISGASETNGISVVPRLEKYIQSQNRTQRDWQEVVREFQTLLDAVFALVNDVKDEDDYLFHQTGDLALLHTLKSKDALVKQLDVMKAPTSPAELDLLRRAVEKNEVLHENAREAAEKLAYRIRIWEERRQI